MYVFLDTETTGLPTRRHAPYTDHEVWPRIVSVSWALFKSPDQQRKHVYSIIRPDGFCIPDEAVRIHGITTDYALENGRPLREVLQELDTDLEFEQPTVAIAHNVAFDFPVLLCESHRLGLTTRLTTLPTRCTMTSSTEYCALPHSSGNGHKWPRLSELHTKLFGVEFDGQHDASLDVLACAKCYFRLVELHVMGTSSSLPPQQNLGQDQPSAGVPDAATERLLSIVSDFAHAHPEFHPGFVYSLRRQFKLHGRLSPKQIMALCNIVAGWRMLERQGCSQQNPSRILSHPVAP